MRSGDEEGKDDTQDEDEKGVRDLRRLLCEEQRKECEDCPYQVVASVWCGPAKRLKKTRAC
jgi:hypothetical protein